MAQFDGKVALVTGAASGIGRSTALAFARDGAMVVAADTNEAGGEQTARLIKDLGGEATFVRADVSLSADVDAMVSAALKAYGRMDYAHNNAGITGAVPGSTPLDYPEEMFDRVIAVNLKSVWLCMRAQVPIMLDQGGGAIVNTASILGLVAAYAGLPGSGAYAAAKHGVIGLTKTFAVSYAAQGVRVNAVCPGYIDTPLMDPLRTANPEAVGQLAARHPAGRLGAAGEVAAAVTWLCSDAASFVTGHSMVVDGGYVAQ
jgi:NAD(P)-dependent dehydrogenase (short-subunit alcohol dehydrogenase family)